MIAQMISWPALLWGFDNSPNYCLLWFYSSYHQPSFFMFFYVMCLCAPLLILVCNKYSGLCAPVWLCTSSDRPSYMICNASYACYYVVSCFYYLLIYMPPHVCSYLPMKIAKETIPPCHASHAMSYAPLHMYNE